MLTATHTSPHASHHATESDSLSHLQAAIDHAAHFLPAQGPITVFIHHNTLHAFEHLSFEEAVKNAAEVFGCQPYLSEERYRAELGKGRIRFDGLRAVLADDLGTRAEELVAGLATRRELRLTMLQFPIEAPPVSELNWLLEQTDAKARVHRDTSAATRGRLLSETRRWVMRDLRTTAEQGNGRNGRSYPTGTPALLRQHRLRDIETWPESTWEAITVELLWNVCLDGVRAVSPDSPGESPTVRPRDSLRKLTGTDIDIFVNEVLVRFCAAFLDQGLSHWPLPERGLGFFGCFASVYRRGFAPPDRWLSRLPHELDRALESGQTPLELVRDSLETLGVPPDEWDEYLTATLLALRGWAGMLREVELRSDRVAIPVPNGTLVEYLAVRLLLERVALEHFARTELGFTGPLSELRDELESRAHSQTTRSDAQRAFPVFQLAQLLGWSPEELHRLQPFEWEELLREIAAFSSVERRRIFQWAYERRLRTQALDAMSLHQRRYPDVPEPRTDVPRFQVIACLDEREESFRRHLEEVAPDAETFGAAGFFGVAMYYRGVADAHFVPLCPIVIQPKHWVGEQVCEEHEETHRRAAQTRRAIGEASHRIHVGTRSFAFGAVLTAGFGVLASIPLVARILFPRLAAKVRHRFGQFVRTPPATQLKLERREAEPGAENGHLGYSVGEMAAIAERFLRDIGLTTRFARLVFVLGHGSTSMNNPHKSAYDCGACGGSPGAPNGRALAQMLNDPRVRNLIAANGITIPESTWFIGGFHNTCDDSVSLADVSRVPETHRAELARVQCDFAETCDRNAHERCRRFMSAPLGQSFAEARRHVQGRSEDLAQTRPELGHATNALCIVARRERSRGLYFDRRAFLTSYDPTQDDAEGSTLMRILSAAVPVCGGINLEYYFSHVDSAGYGCGTKLPHNITSLLGVMDGAASDLRTGLPWQMVEIHEPVRLLFIVESTPDILLGIMDRNPAIGQLIRNGWVQLAVLDPNSQLVRHFHNGQFTEYRPLATHLPCARNSSEWYRGWRDHLEFAEIGEM